MPPITVMLTVSACYITIFTESNNCRIYDGYNYQARTFSKQR